ncbi:MAG TPA: toll/interleukin-1 receptor domain-containing protein [Bryobacteraceae bacterium]
MASPDRAASMRSMRICDVTGVRMSLRQPKLKPVIFVSHTGNDEFIQLLRMYLGDCDVVVSDWRDQAGLLIAKKVREDISRADLVVIVLTEPALRSAWVQQEIGFALGQEKKVVPVLEHLDTSTSDTLPALLVGVEWERYVKTAIPESALRTAMRVSQMLQEDLVRVFRTDWEYRQWWVTMDERLYATENLYWATPHDTWAWLMAHTDQVPTDLKYRVLIRGDLEFDRTTVSSHYSEEEVVFGVRELSGIEETCVIGSLVVHTLWEPDFQEMLDHFLQTAPSGEQLIRWYSDFAHRDTRIEVRVSLDASRAASHRRRLDVLFEKYSRDRASHPIHFTPSSSALRP